MIIGSGMAERFHQRFFRAVPLPPSTTFRSVTEVMCGFNVAGPKSRELLLRLTNADLSNVAFPFMRSKRIIVAGVPVVAIRVSRALMSLRVEKGYGSWGRDYSLEYWPQECGLDKLIKADKDFLNKSAWAAIAKKPPRDVMVMLDIDAKDADATGGEPVFLQDGTPAGQVSSGTYGYFVRKSLAIAYIKAEFALPGTEINVAILGQSHAATVLGEPSFDPAGARLRG
jgi:dimethylglycine dehydrogenase